MSCGLNRLNSNYCLCQFTPFFLNECYYIIYYLIELILIIVFDVISLTIINIYIVVFVQHDPIYTKLIISRLQS